MITPHPPGLRGSAIRTSDAEQFGTTRERLRRSDVQHPFHGVSAVGLELESVRHRCRAALPILEEGQVLSHTTALALLGAPLPLLGPELHISVAFPRTPPRRPGIRGHSLVDAPAILHDGMPVSPPIIAWAQSAALLRRDDLVAVGDHLARDLSSAGDLDALRRVSDSWGSRPGAARLRWAAARIRHGVRSRPETLLRLLLVSSRLPEPEVAHPVAVAAGIVLHPDLAYPDRRLAIEYEGEGHRDRGRWESDIERRELLADVGWRTVRVTRRQLFGDPADLMQRIRRHHAT